MADLVRAATVEALGTAALVATVIGSGIMATRLTDDLAVALLANSLATGAILVVLITILAPLSGAHLNPAVTLVFALRRELRASLAVAYGVAQVAGGIAGAVLAHAMFELPFVVASVQVRTGPGQWLAEGVATFGLVFVILLGIRANRAAVPVLVGLYITAAYWFTASTSFANPAVTIARTLTDSFAGISPASALAFLPAQAAGAIAALGAVRWLVPPAERAAGTDSA